MATSSNALNSATEAKQRRIPLSPAEGWSTVILAATLVLITVGCIEVLQWTPNSDILTSTTLVGMALGFTLAKQRYVPQWLADIPALAFGVFFAFWQTANADEGGSLSALAASLRDWAASAKSGASSTDNSIFLLFLAVLTMLLGYVSMWLIFRSRSPWLAAIANIIVLLINLNYATDDKFIYAIFFMLVTLLLLVRYNLAERMRIWQRKGLRFSSELTWDFMQAGGIFAIVVMLLAAFLPSGAVAGSLQNIWSGPNSPWQNAQSTFNRLFHVSGNARGQARVSFDSSLKLQGSVNLPNTIQLTYITPDTSGAYFQAVAYDTYSLKDNTWTMNKDTLKITQLPTSQQLVPETKAVTTVTTAIHIVTAPLESYIYTIGEPESFSTPAVVTSDGVGLVDGDTNGSYTAWQAPQALHDGQNYTAQSYISTATADQLRKVLLPSDPNAQNYPAALLTRYTQLPDDLANNPANSVAQTAQQWTNGQTTMYDKVKAIVDNFHADGFTYSADNPEPPAGVDYATWLLQQKKGFCTWYATGFVLMARSLGIPARVVSGFVRGAYDSKTGQYVVRGTDAHMWAQVYFPGYGWINFEPSVSFLSLPLPSKSTGNTDNTDPPPTKPHPQPRPNPGGATTPAIPVTLPGKGQGQALGTGGVVAISLSTLLAILLLATLGIVTWWRLLFRSLSPISQTFARMALLGKFAGIRASPAQTATEYGASLAQRLPEQREAISEITELYVRERWAPEEPATPHNLSERWQTVRDSLVRRVRVPWPPRLPWRRS